MWGASHTVTCHEDCSKLVYKSHATMYRLPAVMCRNIELYTLLNKIPIVVSNILTAYFEKSLHSDDKLLSSRNMAVKYAFD